MATVQSPAEQRVLLRNVSWETYERLLAENQSASVPRLTYDRGALELMSPLPIHERLNRAAQMLVPLAARQLGHSVYSLGSTTFRRADIQRGFEPDSCFYVQNAAHVRGKPELDLSTDPPPDLVVEIDISSPSLPRLPIFAEFGVPEVWRHDGERCEILLLDGSEYTEAEHSRALPLLTASHLTALLNEAQWLDDVAWLDRVQEWLRGTESA